MGRRGEVAGFWDSPSLRSAAIPPELQLTLGEAGTPLQPSTHQPRVLLKREDLNPTGSHKDRAAAYQLAQAAARGDRAVTISSSGNAGIATSRYAELHGLPAIVCVHPSTDPEKLDALDGATTLVIVTERAINSAKLIARELKIPNLRPSVSDDALVGYATLGDELAAAEIDAVVLFATSGASALAVANVFVETGRPRPVHFVQGEGNAALADPSAAVTTDTAHSAAAGRLGVRRTRRGKALLAAVEQTGGRGWSVSSATLEAARFALSLDDIEVSDESAANYAIAFEVYGEFDMTVACVISGSPPAPQNPPAPRIGAVDEHEALEHVRRALSHPLQ